MRVCLVSPRLPLTCATSCQAKMLGNGQQCQVVRLSGLYLMKKREMGEHTAHKKCADMGCRVTPSYVDFQV